MALLNALRFLSSGVIFAIFALIATDVLVRSIGLSPWTYTSGIVEYGLLWFTMLAGPYLLRIKGHVFIDAVTQLMPGAIQRVLAKLVYVIGVCACSTFCYYSVRLLLDAIETGEIDTRGEDMLYWTLYFPMPICFLLMAIEFARFLLGVDTMYGDRTEVRDSV